MKTLRLTFKLFWIGICALAMLLQTQLLLCQKLQPDALSGFVFCSVVFGYNFRVLHSTLRPIAWCFGAAAAFFFFQLSFLVQVTTILPALILGAYYGFSHRDRPGLRTFLWAKPTAIALAWAWVTVLLPALHFSPTAVLPTILMFFERATFIFALALAYDISDVSLDTHKGLLTFPVQYGVRKTLFLIFGMLILTGLFGSIAGGLGYFPASVVIALWSSLAVSGWVIRQLAQKRGQFYWYKNIVDGLMLLQLLSIVIAFSTGKPQ